jgi:organic radical activating enzyme
MPIFALDNEIELVVTWVCNWHCDYCCVDTHARPKLDMEEVLSKIDKIPNNCNVTLSGGEVGSMKRKDIEFIIAELEKKECKLHINTNGLFIRRYRDLLSHFETILYHCSENLDITDDIIVDPEYNLEYLLIVTDNNFEKLGPFLDKYRHIKFHIVASTMPKGITGSVLSAKNKYTMITKYHSHMTKESKLRAFNEKNFDAITYI